MNRFWKKQLPAVLLAMVMVLGMAPAALAADCALNCAQVLVGLTAFMQVGLAEVSLEPYAVRLLPPVKCSMADSPLIRYLRSLNESK